ncbi:hypothetical protein MK079_03960 [Candidatus Gracilibacteria bacterium]|nr:hypothetical protein [Candidatus Gracilibacteria bacterium]
MRTLEIIDIEDTHGEPIAQDNIIVSTQGKEIVLHPSSGKWHEIISGENGLIWGDEIDNTVCLGLCGKPQIQQGCNKGLNCGKFKGLPQVNEEAKRILNW